MKIKPLAFAVGSFALAGEISSAFAQIEEIVVTAQRRAETVQEVPIAITAFSGEKLQQLNINQTSDLAAQTPSLQIADSNFGVSAPVISLRGISNADFSAISNTPITVYSDDIVLNNVQTHGFAMFDLDRVEVLKGPQGTLFGRNSTSGAIQAISASPTDEFTAGIDLDLSRFNSVRTEGYVSSSLIEDKLRARLSFLKDTSDGAVEDRVTGEDLEERDLQAVRLTLSSDINDSLSAKLKIQHQRIDGDNAVFHNGLQDNSTVAAQLAQINAGIGGLLPTQPTTAGSDGNYRKLSLSPQVERQEKGETSSAAFTLNWDIGDVTLTSVTGYIEHDLLSVNDSDGASQIYSTDFQDTRQRQFSQELRLSGGTDNWDWVTGLYYFKENVKADQAVFAGDLPVYRALALEVNLDAFFNPIIDGPIALGSNLSLQDQDLTSIAAFTHHKYSFNEEWSMTVGARWSQDKKTLDHQGSSCFQYNRDRQDFTNINGISAHQGLVPGDSQETCPGLFETRESDKWNAITGRISTEYRFSDDTMFYASYARGFKGGGFPGFAGREEEFLTVDPETVDAFEIGAKSSWFDNRMILNGALFYYDYSDYQLNISEAINASRVDTYFTNVPEIKVQGLELDLTAEPADNWLVTFGLSWLDTEVKKAPTIRGTVRDEFAGNELPQAPHLSLNGVISYRWQLSDGFGSLTPQVDWNWSSKYFVNLENTEKTTILANGEVFDSRGGNDVTTNLRLTWENDDATLAMTAYIENLEDHRNPLFSLPTITSVTGTNAVNPSQPRTFGLNLRYHFE